MSTFFNTCKRNFKDVPVVDGKINTTEFLEAAESVVLLFEVLGNTAFVPVQKDMTSNIKKIRDAQLARPASSGTLQEIVDSDPKAAEGLLWLNRGLEFTSLALRKNVDSDEELSDSFTSSYVESLKKHHNMLVRGIFSVAMRACPYRNEFYKKLGDDQAAVDAEMREWLAALEEIVKILNAYLAQKKIK